MLYYLSYPLDDHGYKIVQDRDEQSALGTEWFEKPGEATTAFERKPIPEQLQILSHTRNPAEAIDRFYNKRFESAPGNEKLGVVREYRDNYPHFALNSEWARPYLAHLPPAELQWAESGQRQPISMSPGGASPLLKKYRSEVKRAILIQLTKNPDATDIEICRGLDADGAVEMPDDWVKTRAGDRLWKNAYRDRKLQHKIETTISKVRSDLRTIGLLSRR
ncbi:MAG: hypothetical protein LAP13_09310 [Acidobacteriia bacterium]|nr:hypothetical protein [Terriglobia bacterium]